MQEPQNVVVIIADDLSNTLGCYGAAGVISPNIDRLAARGIKFDRAYCQASLCNPSRASILSGRRPHQLGIWDNDPHFRGIYPRLVTLPQHFKENGYHSVGIGKIFHNWAQAIEGDPISWSEPQIHHWGIHAQDWYVAGRVYRAHTDLPKGAAVQSVDVPDEAYLDGRIANAAVDKLRELQETPFFLAVGFWKPHLPYNAPQRYWDLYDRNKLPQVIYTDPVGGVSEFNYVDSDEARSYTDVPKEGPVPVDKQQELRHGYLAAISYLDAQVGKILDELDRLDLTDNTTIVFVSDHGYHAGEHGQFGKWTNFEQGTRVPLIIASPGNTRPKTASNSLVELVDLYPTLLEVADLPAPRDEDKMGGTSILTVLKDPTASVNSYAVSQISRPLGAGPDFGILGSTIRNADYRYTEWTDRATDSILAQEFYDLTDNMFTVDNRANDPRYANQLQALRDAMKSILAE
ncbi:MAG: sulfatase [Lewinella sp.]